MLSWGRVADDDYHTAFCRESGRSDEEDYDDHS